MIVFKTSKLLWNYKTQLNLMQSSTIIKKTVGGGDKRHDPKHHHEAIEMDFTYSFSRRVFNFLVF